MKPSKSFFHIFSFSKIYFNIVKGFLLLIISQREVIGQITLSSPKNRMVYQRNALNKADIFIEGSFVGEVDKIEARLIGLDSNGQPLIPSQISDWQTIVSCPLSNNFSGAIFNQNAGWYVLEIKISMNNQDIGNPALVKVGIGEVFVISGQSNAGGLVPFLDPFTYASNDDRINCINLNDNSLNIPAPMVFSKLEYNSFIAPIGVTSWCWGAFGEQIVNNWNVPVLFFNAANGGTSIFEWRASANLEADYCGANAQECAPYFHLKKTLIHYAKKTGLRAVLWHQGENDLGNFEGGQIPGSVYKNNMKQVIDKSRADFQENISWVVAKVSRVGNSISPRVLEGQQMIIDSVNYNTFQGPNSDDIQPSYNERDTGGVHFWGQGLIDLGNSWFNFVNTVNFKTNSTPFPAKFEITGYHSIKSGNWNDPLTWSGRRIPTGADDVIICNNHTVVLSTIGNAKKLYLNGELQLEGAGEIKLFE